MWERIGTNWCMSGEVKEEDECWGLAPPQVCLLWLCVLIWLLELSSNIREVSQCPESLQNQPVEFNLRGQVSQVTSYINLPSLNTHIASRSLLGTLWKLHETKVDSSMCAHLVKLAPRTRPVIKLWRSGTFGKFWAKTELVNTIPTPFVIQPLLSGVLASLAPASNNQQHSRCRILNVNVGPPEKNV